MVRKKWIDKKTATHFTLVHRPQNDPLIHDSSASSMVLNPTILPNAKKSKKLDELASELGSEIDEMRENEGEAASYGIYFDDSKYDYMQHMRDLGCSSGEAYFVEALTTKKIGKEKQSLDEEIKNISLEDRVEQLLDESILPSKNLQKATYQAQQDVPDILAGFKPDMDPRLREVLEALEDDAYVDDEAEIFDEITKDSREVDENEFDQDQWDEEEEDGWQSDTTAKPLKEYKTPPNLVPDGGSGEPEDHGDGAWMKDFNRFKKDQNTKPKHVASSQLSSMMTTTTNGGRRKKRKGALTNPSSYSMTSSSMVRTEGLTTLDARFEKIEEQYNEDMDDIESVSGAPSIASTVSSVQGPIREDFDGIMDEFLGGFSMSGKKHVKKGKYQSGLEQLDEIRKNLGPAIIRPKKIVS
ncbi:hypothetical protein K3495_g10450 [Podosphaera aphanis]|nr:hypothetical protein K3495_g10450 [Podosphaera aphanis]